MAVPAGRYPQIVAALEKAQTATEYRMIMNSLSDDETLALEAELSRVWDRLDATHNLTQLLTGNL